MSEPEKKPFSVKQAMLPASLALFFLGVFAACLFTGKFGFVYNFVKDFFAIEIGLATSISSLAAAVAVFTLFIALPSMICRKILARSIHQGVSLSIGYVCALLLVWYPSITSSARKGDSPSVSAASFQPAAQLAENKSYIETANGINLEMVWIPGGAFIMGSNDGREDERPAHRVELDGFWIGKYEVTISQWEAIAGGKLLNTRIVDHFPKNRVALKDCMDFCRKLTELSGRSYQVPSEAQWEYACRAGSITKYFFGDAESELDDYAWFESNSSGKTHAVGLKNPNAFGLHDMYGNVLEWCQDSYHGNYTGFPSDGSAWLTPTEQRGVLRGGSSPYSAEDCRSTSRHSNPVDRRRSYSGLRLARIP